MGRLGGDNAHSFFSLTDDDDTMETKKHIKFAEKSINYTFTAMLTPCLTLEQYVLIFSKKKTNI